MKYMKCYGNAAILCIAALMIVSTAVTADTLSTTAEEMTMAPMDKGIVFEDSFESYADFALDFPPWTNVDLDGTVTWGSADYEFENTNYAGAFIVFNAATTTPPANAAGSAWCARTGDKTAACFAARPDEGPMNDDWLISPCVILGDQIGAWFGIHCVSRDSFVLLIDDVQVTSDNDGTGTVSFWAKSITDTYGLDRFQFGYSAEGTAPEGFTIVSEGEYLEAPLEWTEFTFEIVGGPVSDDVAPVTTVDLQGEKEGEVFVDDVTVTMTAIDDLTGVDEIYYKLDGASTWMTYDGSFIVDTAGTHTIECYAVDNAENEETPFTTTFTIAYPAEIVIDGITGGFGKVSVDVSNIGRGIGEDIDWDISFEGGLVLSGPASGTIVSLASEESTIVESGFVLGFGSTIINVVVGDSTASQEAMILLVLVQI